MNRVITGVVQPTGWHFIQESVFRIEAESYQDLLNNVMDWRIQNGRNVGNVEQDVEDYICSHYPNQCKIPFRGVQKYIVPLTPPQQTRFIDLLVQWGLAIRLKKEANELVLDPVANKRGESCVNCPHNVVWENQCPPCVQNGLRLFSLIRKNHDSAHWRKLHGCDLMNHDNRSAIFLPKELFNVNDSAPDFCWLKKGE